MVVVETRTGGVIYLIFNERDKLIATNTNLGETRFEDAKRPRISYLFYLFILQHQAKISVTVNSYTK